MLRNDNYDRTISIFSGTKIKINNSFPIYIFDSYDYSDDILYCRRLKAHKGLTVIGELINKEENIIAFKKDKISILSIELDPSLISIGREMNYKMNFGNKTLAPVGAYFAGHLGALKGSLLAILPASLLIPFIEKYDQTSALAATGRLAFTGFVVAESVTHSTHIMNWMKTGFVDIPLTGISPWEIDSDYKSIKLNDSKGQIIKSY